MTDIDRNGPVAPAEPERKEERNRASTARSRATSDAMMQALEDDMDRRPDVYRRLAAS